MCNTCCCVGKPHVPLFTPVVLCPRTAFSRTRGGAIAFRCDSDQLRMGAERKQEFLLFFFRAPSPPCIIVLPLTLVFLFLYSFSLSFLFACSRWILNVYRRPQCPPMSTHTPHKLVDWWMEKTPEERRVYLSDPATTPDMKKNVLLVESYCATRSYRAYVESGVPLSRRRLGCHVFPSGDEWMSMADSEDDADEEEQKPGVGDKKNRSSTAAQSGGGRDLVMADGVTLSLGTRALLAPHSPLSGIGERPRGCDEGREEERQLEAAAVIAPAQARLRSFLADVVADRADDIAKILIRLVQEAATAAACRVGIPEAIEKKAEDEQRRLAQRQKRVLVLSKERPDPAAKHVVETRDLSSSQSIPRPIGARSNDYHGFLGMCLLTQPLLDRLPDCTTDAGKARAAGHKRSRHAAHEGPAAGEESAGQAWTSLRAEISAVPLPGGGVGMVACDKAPSVTITEQDVLFALQRVKRDW